MSNTNAILVYDGDLYTGPRVWNEGTDSWNTMGTANGTVYAMMEYDGDLILAGTFTTLCDVAHDYIARWEGSALHTLGSGLSGTAKALAI